jgi:hypothetical protein
MAGPFLSVNLLIYARCGAGESRIHILLLVSIVVGLGCEEELAIL